MNSGKVLLGLLAGIAAGATLGILFAPEKGSKTRRRITDKGDEYANELGDKFDEFMDTVTRKMSVVKKEAARMAENGRAKAQEIEDDLIAAAK